MCDRTEYGLMQLENRNIDTASQCNEYVPLFLLHFCYCYYSLFFISLANCWLSTHKSRTPTQTYVQNSHSVWFKSPKTEQINYFIFFSIQFRYIYNYYNFFFFRNKFKSISVSCSFIFLVLLFAPIIFNSIDISIDSIISWKFNRRNLLISEKSTKMTKLISFFTFFVIIPGNIFHLTKKKSKNVKNIIQNIYVWLNLHFCCRLK